MKRSGFKNPGKGLSRKTPLRTKTPISRGESTIKASKPMERSNKPKMKSRGMKGRAPTAEEQRFMNRMGALPCIACWKDGRHEPVISLHHIDGRTKPGAHFLVLPLCSPHHQQDDADTLQRQSVHGRKATFTARYGTEMELLAECMQKIEVPNE